MKNNKQIVDLAIIGGTGSDVTLDNIEERKVYTPYGSTSATITVGEFMGKNVAFIPRHGISHGIENEDIDRVKLSGKYMGFR